MNKGKDMFRGILFLLGIFMVIGFGGTNWYPQQLEAQPLLGPPTNTDKELKNALQSGQPVLVDFGSNKCIPCRQIRPILKDVAKEFSGKAHVLIIDVFQYQELARQHRIHLIPTLVFFDAQGKETFRRSGVWDKASIARKLKEAGSI
jgi:thioredoxin 1